MHEALSEWLAFLRAERHVLRERPRLLLQQAANRRGDAPSRAAEKVWRDGRESRPWLRRLNEAPGPSAIATFTGHRHAVTKCVFSPDGRRVLSGSKDGTWRAWDVSTGRELREAAPRGAGSVAALSPDGRYLVHSRRGEADEESVEVALSDLETGALVRTLGRHGRQVEACDLSSDGERFASGARDGTLLIGSVASSAAAEPISGHETWVETCVLAPGGRQLATSGGVSEYSVRLWDVGRRRLVANVEEHESAVVLCAYSPDGRLLTCATRGVPRSRGGPGWIDPGSFELIDVSRRRRAAILPGHDAPVCACAFSPDCEKLVSGDTNGVLKIWSVQRVRTRQRLRRADHLEIVELATLSGHEASINCCAFSPDAARILSASRDGTLKVWDSRTGALQASLGEHSGEVNAAAFSPDGALIVSASDDATLKLWRTPTEPVPSEGVRVWNACAFSPDGAHLAAGAHGRDRGPADLVLLDGRTGDRLWASVGAHDDWIVDCAFSPDGSRLVSASLDGTLKLWGPDQRDAVPLRGHSRAVTRCVFAAGGLRIVSASDDGTVRLWDGCTGDSVAALSATRRQRPVWDLSPDKTAIACAAPDGTLRFFDVATGDETASAAGHGEESITSCGYSPDGARLVSGAYDGSLKLWETATGRELATPSGHGDWIAGCSFSPDGSRIVSANRHGVPPRQVLRDGATGDPVKELGTPDINDVRWEFSPGGARLVAHCKNDELRLWDAATGDELATLSRSPVGVLLFGFSPDGAWLFAFARESEGWFGAADVVLRLCDPQSGHEICAYPLHSSPSVAAWSDSGDRLVVATRTGEVHLLAPEWPLTGRRASSLA